MSRVTVRTKGGTTLRLDSARAHAELARGAVLVYDDQAGVATYNEYLVRSGLKRLKTASSSTKKKGGDSADDQKS